MLEYAAVILLACLMVLVIGVLVGVGAAYLARRDGATYPAALRQGCTALASTLLVVTALVSAFVAVLPR
jgi:heme/copper-type cytochrome/quinol oxidase subunit 2